MTPSLSCIRSVFHPADASPGEITAARELAGHAAPDCTVGATAALDSAASGVRVAMATPERLKAFRLPSAATGKSAKAAAAAT